ncbi:MAG: GGDEF domain-containing protein [Candidatus Eisenbacteria bacterium]|nr:GGDEF domain-containing protein [Candidatus Eisenbacteria bacterium]
MKQKVIDFRELLERLLPLDELPPPDRLRIHRALATGAGTQIEQAALAALSQLEHAGALRRLPADDAFPSRLRYQRLGDLNVISLQLPATEEREGFLLFPRATLPAQAQAGIDQMRRLLRLDDPRAVSDPRRDDPRLALTEQLDLAGREFLGADSVRLVLGTDDESGSEPPFDRALTLEARRHPDCILYAADLSRAPRLEPAARERGALAMALVAVTGSDGQPLGVIEVASRQRDPFRLEDLSRVALLADYCGRALERVARIEKLVFIDPLTQVYNRSYFDLQLANEMARAQREQNSMALCIADIDDFKSFNTAFGYEAGNAVLVQVAQALRGGVRPFDTVARWGGEEFSILLTAPVQAEDVATACERLRLGIERIPVSIEGLDRRSHRLGVTLSLGVAMYPDHAETAQDLWRAANQALLKAKRGPKNQVVFFTPERDSRFNAS